VLSPNCTKDLTGRGVREDWRVRYREGLGKNLSENEGHALMKGTRRIRLEWIACRCSAATTADSSGTTNKEAKRL
jgi:hypothetical protein